MMRATVWNKVPIYPALSALLVMLTWTGMISSGLVPESVLPRPATVLKALQDEVREGRLAGHLSASGFRLLVGFEIGASLGALLGLMLGAWLGLRSALLPIIEVLRPIPPLAWIPVVLIWLGIGEESKIF